MMLSADKNLRLLVAVLWTVSALSWAEPGDHRAPTVTEEAAPSSPPARGSEQTVTRQDALLDGMRSAGLSRRAVESVINAVRREGRVDSSRFSQLVDELQRDRGVLSISEADRLKQLFREELGTLDGKIAATELTQAAESLLASIEPPSKGGEVDAKAGPSKGQADLGKAPKSLAAQNALLNEQLVKATTLLEEMQAKAAQQQKQGSGESKKGDDEGNVGLLAALLGKGGGDNKGGRPPFGGPDGGPFGANSELGRLAGRGRDRDRDRDDSKNDSKHREDLLRLAKGRGDSKNDTSKAPPPASNKSSKDDDDKSSNSRGGKDSKDSDSSPTPPPSKEAKKAEPEEPLFGKNSKKKKAENEAKNAQDAAGANPALGAGINPLAISGKSPLNPIGPAVGGGGGGPGAYNPPMGPGAGGPMGPMGPGGGGGGGGGGFGGGAPMMGGGMSGSVPMVGQDNYPMDEMMPPGFSLAKPGPYDGGSASGGAFDNSPGGENNSAPDVASSRVSLASQPALEMRTSRREKDGRSAIEYRGSLGTLLCGGTTALTPELCEAAALRGI